MLLSAEVVITSSVASGSLLKIEGKTAAMLTAITPRPFPLLKRSEESSFSSVSNEGSLWFRAEGLVLRVGGTGPLQWSLQACDRYV